VAVAERVGAPRPLAHAFVRLGSALIETQPGEALAQYTRAMQIFSGLDDRLGQIRCYINGAIANSRLGASAEAERSSSRALELGREARAPDLAGLASLNLGVQQMQGGDYASADERFVEALELFTAVRNEKHRLAALYNRAHLARERGDPSAAMERYDQCVQLAGQIGQPDVEIGAVAGLGLASLALGETEAADRWHWVARLLIAIRDDWSFQGRELVEALGIRLALGRGEQLEARELFREALSRAADTHLKGACWLAADCGAPIVATGDEAARSIIAGYALRAESLGFVPLMARLAAITGRIERPGSEGSLALIA
jgi:tetratricopeptide (TPR) repeat protein